VVPTPKQFGPGQAVVWQSGPDIGLEMVQGVV
jgi:hypothetical protein